MPFVHQISSRSGIHDDVITSLELHPDRRFSGQYRDQSKKGRVRTNAVQRELVAQPNIIGETKGHCLRWMGHLKRLGESGNLKSAYLGRPAGRRSVGRPSGSGLARSSSQ